jgi:hypothetical protein
MSEKNREKSQPDKFREAAREVNADDDEKHFDERLKHIGKPRRDPKIIGRKPDAP